MTDKTHTILVCDDEAEIREMLNEYLSKRGYEVIEASQATELREKLAAGDVDLILLDINMPGEDGLSVLRSLQEDDAPGVIMLTAAGDVVDRIIGLEFGADDYLGKPVDLRELEARIKAVLRRRGAAAPAETETARAEEKTLFQFGKAWLNLDSATLTDEDGQQIPLTAMEFNLLALFARNKGRVLNRDQILEGAHDRTWDPFDRSIDIRISRLRKKIEVNPQKPAVIRTVRGVGYLYDGS
jgi:two-component system phosphate regulon response regulator OmpR